MTDEQIELPVRVIDFDGINLVDSKGRIVATTRSVHLAHKLAQVFGSHDALVSALEAALADGGLFQATELQIKEALKMARGE